VLSGDIVSLVVGRGVLSGDIVSLGRERSIVR
jgi:hypothetical protein